MAMVGRGYVAALAPGSCAFAAKQGASRWIKPSSTVGGEGTRLPDARGVVVYANAAYLALTDADQGRRSCARFEPASSSAYRESESGLSLCSRRRARARRLQEEVRVSRSTSETGAGCGCAVRQLDDSKPRSS